MHAFVRSPLCLFRVNQSINQSINQSPQQSFEPARKPPPNAYRPTTATASSREEPPSRRIQKTPASRPAPPRPPPVSPRQSMSAARWAARVPPLCPCVYPLHVCTPGTHIPLPPPSRRSTTRRSGHVHGPRAGGDIAPPLPHHTKNEKQKKRAPPYPFKNAKINTPRGRSSSYSTHPRVRPTLRAHPRARWITSDATSAGRAGRVYRVHAPVTTHEKRLTKNDRAHHIGIGIVDAPSSPNRASAVRDARVRSIRSTPSDALERSIPFTTVSSPTVARARRRARARRGRKPRASTDATDRRRRPTTNDDDEDESIRTQGRRYGTRARLDAIEMIGARARGRRRASRAARLGRQRQPRPRRNTRVVCV